MTAATLRWDPLDLLTGRVGRSPRGAELLAIQREAARQTPLSIETILRTLPDAESVPGTVLDLIVAEIATRRENGEVPTAADYAGRFPILEETLEMLFAAEFDSVGLSGLRQVGHALDSVALQATDAAHETPPFPARTRERLPVIAGYAILGVLGRGGMGIVYKGLHLRLDRIVALKMMAMTNGNPVRRLRFLAEAEIVASLQHPHIVQLHEIGEHDGESFFTLEYCPGGTLVSRYGSQPVPVVDAARIVADLAAAVAYAHGRNILHRDLKPENVLLASDDTPKISDFGLARRLDDEAGLTATGDLLGTPAYMAPEQAAPTRTPVGPLADVYGLGAILYRLLSGQPPFTGMTPLATLEKVLHSEPVALRTLNPLVPLDLQSICCLAMAKDPRHRYASAQLLADDLRRFLAGCPVHARPVPRSVQAWRWARRNRGLAIALTTCAAALMGITALSVATALTTHRNAQLQQQLLVNDQQRREVQNQVEQVLHARLEQAYADIVRSNYEDAERNLSVAEAALKTVDSPPEWSVALSTCRKDLRFAMQLEDANIIGAESRPGPVAQDGFDTGTISDRTHEQLFRAAGFPLFDKTPEDAGAELRSATLREVLAKALLRWAFQAQDHSRKKHLYAVAALVHDDPLQKRFLIAIRDRTPQVIQALTEAELFSLPSEFVRLGALMKSTQSDQLLKRALLQRPDDFWLQIHLGKVLRIKGDPASLTDAAGAFRTAIALRPRAPGPYVLLGTVLYESGKPAEAAQVCQSWLQPGRDNPAIRFVLARSRDLLGDAAAAEAEYRAAIRADATYANAYYNLALLLKDQGRIDEAAAQYDQCLRVAPKHAQSMVNRGLIHLDQSQLPLAEAAFLKAIQLDPKLMYAHNAMGSLRQRQGKLAEAAESYREALRLQPGHPMVLANLEAVEKQLHTVP